MSYKKVASQFSAFVKSNYPNSSGKILQQVSTAIRDLESKGNPINPNAHRFHSTDMTDEQVMSKLTGTGDIKAKHVNGMYGLLNHLASTGMVDGNTRKVIERFLTSAFQPIPEAPTPPPAVRKREHKPEAFKINELPDTRMSREDRLIDKIDNPKPSALASNSAEALFKAAFELLIS